MPVTSTATRLVLSCIDRKRRRQLGELGEGGFEFLDDLSGEHARGRKQRGVVKRLVAQPGDVEVGLVTRNQVVVAEAAEPFTLDPSTAVIRRVASTKWARSSARSGLVLRVKCMFVRRSYTHVCFVHGSAAAGLRSKNSTFAFTPWA